MGAAPLSWLAKIGGDTLKTKAKLLSSAINELYDNGFKKKDIVGLDYIKAATADDLKNKVPEANAVKELNSNFEHIISDAYKYHVPASELASTGWKTPNINQELTIPDGYSFAGIFAYTGTYRIAAIQPVIGTSAVSFTFYLLASLSTDIDIVWRAVFKKI